MKERAMRIGPILAVFVSMLAMSAMFSPARATEADAMVPQWRLQALAFSSHGGDLSLGAYHRLGQSWEVGSELDSRFSDSTEDEDGLTQEPDFSGVTTTSESRRYRNVEATVELRRWVSIEPGLSWFFGSQVGVGYTDQCSEYDQVDTSPDRMTDKAHGPSGTVAMVLGADLRLLHRLSATFALRPIRYSHSWLDTERSSTRQYTGSTDWYTDRRTGTRHSWDLSTGLAAEVYFTLRLGK
jgi:hypothetical protein